MKHFLNEDGLHEKIINVKKITFADSNDGGENYCSKIFRVKVLYQRSKHQFDEEISLIVKSIAITPATQFLDDLSVFLTEKVFYLDVLEKLELLIADGSKFGAKCLFTKRKPLQTIVFDDLTQYGYKLANRLSGLDEEHCITILKKLAKFHASSMVLIKRDCNIKEHFQKRMLEENYVRTSERFIDFMSLILQI
ncbi:uncharacterized protein ACRADG_007062 [Cochliomyia hominivorax]